MTRSSFLEALIAATRIALPLAQVDRVLRAVALHAVPGAPGCLLGAMDLAGELVSVYDGRRLLGLPPRPLQPSDRIVLSRSPLRCGLVVDAVVGTVEAMPEPFADPLALRAAGLRGVARSASGVLLVQDLGRLLALQRAIPIAGHG